MSVPSPCTDVCRMDAASGRCEGCQRTLAEIAAWAQLDDDEKRAILRVLPERRAEWQRRRAAPSAEPRP